jgi:hypothetical protein
MDSNNCGATSKLILLTFTQQVDTFFINFIQKFPAFYNKTSTTENSIDI